MDTYRSVWGRSEVVISLYAIKASEIESFKKQKYPKLLLITTPHATLDEYRKQKAETVQFERE